MTQREAVTDAEIEAGAAVLLGLTFGHIDVRDTANLVLRAARKVRT